jgi:hypothetical protein
MRLVIQEMFFYCSSLALCFLLFKASKGVGQILNYLNLGEGVVSLSQFCFLVVGYVVLGLWLHNLKFRLFKAE